MLLKRELINWKVHWNAPRGKENRKWGRSIRRPRGAQSSMLLTEAPLRGNGETMEKQDLKR